jgi:rhodanese-related sulfurtransferase
MASAAVQLQPGDVLAFGHQQLTALHTPGHTAGSMCYLWQDHVLTGDTLLINGCGRTDFLSGSAEALYDSLTLVLWALPPATTVWPGHDYQGRHHSTIGHEKAANPWVAGKTRQAFVAALNALDRPTSAHPADVLPLDQTLSLRHDADAVALTRVRPAEGYAGDVSPQLAYQWFLSGEAVLVDVRSDAEREWVGFVPGAVPLSWKLWPGMALNPDFDAALKAAVPSGKKVVLLCRSGVRSIAAAKRATEALGLEAYNILEGFEGDPDRQAHRNLQDGWRFRGLPWRQN